jgi:uncharacterized membrane protein YczE
MPRRRVVLKHPTSLPARICWFALGLAGLAAGLSLLVEARLGLPPWDILIFGSADLLHISPVVTRVGVIALALACIPFAGGDVRFRSLVASLVFGPMVSAALTAAPAPGQWWLRLIFVVVGVVLCGVGLGIYIIPRLAVGPTDELCMLLAERGQRPLWQVRGSVESSVLVLGWVIGGVIGLATVAYAVGHGPVMHATIDWVTRVASNPD